MTTIEIDRIRARYHEVDPAELSVLDAALRVLADDVLEDELAGAELAGGWLAGHVAGAYAVCVDELTVRVDLDVTDSRLNVASAWAGEILDALRRAIDDGGGPHDDGVVVYHREVDALVDLVAAVATGDRRRLWAWQQIGLVPRSAPWPAPTDVADALVARPALVPAVFAVAGGPIGAVFGPADYVRVAHAVASILPAAPSAAGPGDTIESDPVASADRRGIPHDPAVPRHTDADRAVEAAAGVVPEHVWAAVTEPRDRRVLALLALLVARPHLVDHPAAVAALLRRAPLSSQRLRDGADPDPDPPSAHADRSGRPATTSDPDAAVADRAEPAAADEASTVEPAPAELVSAWGGVLFLIHPFRALDVPAALDRWPLAAVDPIEALAAIVVELTGAPAVDPAVRVLIGRRDDDPAAPWTPTTDVEHEAIGRLAGGVRSWMLDRAQGRLGDLGPVWRRNVSIAAAPGWVEVTFSLDDVDLGVRLAGLDLDPGFVWWLGSVVGFRYV